MAKFQNLIKHCQLEASQLSQQIIAENQQLEERAREKEQLLSQLEDQKRETKQVEFKRTKLKIHISEKKSIWMIIVIQDYEVAQADTRAEQSLKQIIIQERQIRL